MDREEYNPFSSGGTGSFAWLLAMWLMVRRDGKIIAKAGEKT
ncbi:hypothetical protein [Brevibacillus invocatus]|nr:hypothetical protein [Brevibacillus invocatus]